MIWKIDLAWIADQMGLLPCRTFCECAVGPIEISVAKGFIGNCSHMILIEPNPQLAAKASYEFKLPITKAAIGFEHRKSMMVENGGSSYLDGTWAPTPVRTGWVYPIDQITFDEIDDGEIEILALDCEGMEWAVLSKMRSRPYLLTVEIWENNPYKHEIMEWLEVNGYIMRFSTGPTAETYLYTDANHTNPRWD